MYQSQIDGLNAGITSLRGELSTARENTVGRTEYDLMDRLLGTIDRRTGDVTGLVKGFMANPPNPFPAVRKKRQSRGLSRR